MLSYTSKFIIKKLLSKANISINGDNPWDLTILNENFFKRVLFNGSLGLGESYMDGWWDCEAIDEFIYRLLEKNLNKSSFSSKSNIPKYFSSLLFNKQKKSKAFEIGEKHYNRGNELFKNMLDKRMIYSCAYWKDSQNLDDAQENKLDLVCRKLNLKPNMKILDIGCGWGGFLKFAYEKYNVKGVGITVSKEQAALAEDICRGLPVEIRLTDYRELKNEQFDHIVSIGMFEHVGYKNYRKFMKIVSKLLKDNGLFLLHTIGTDSSVRSTDPWINKYIFPNGMLPSPVQITKAIEGIFKIEDLHNFGADYDRTLMCWYDNFERYYSSIENRDEKFYRMWKYYLLLCAGAFRARYIQVWQIVLSKKGVKGGYKSIR